SGDTAVVVAQNHNPHLLHRPTVVLLRDCESDEPEQRQIDLAVKSPEQPVYPYRIVGTIYDRNAEQQKTGCFLTK
ncbi:MAG TPA: hypothetical protein VMX58_12450, partial [Patescibacteria group bacterium]|nr:hypothetical protein [Patescibacteria group bacterium]